MRTDPRKPSLAHCIAAVNGDRLAGDVARFVTAEPQNGIGDLFSSAEALDGHKGLQHLVQLWPLAFGDHLVGHRRLDHTGADVIHADAASRVAIHARRLALRCLRHSLGTPAPADVPMLLQSA
jgi:hypothetical protein